MHTRDRDRFILAGVAALVFHVIVFVVISVVARFDREMPFREPIYIELGEPEIVETEPEETEPPEPEETEPVEEPEPEPIPEPEPEPEPVEPLPEDLPEETEVADDTGAPDPSGGAPRQPEPDPTPEAETQPEPEPTPAPDPEPEPAVADEPDPGPEPEPTPSPEPDEPADDAGPDEVAAAREPEPDPEPQPDPGPEPQPEPEPEPTPEETSEPAEPDQGDEVPEGPQPDDETEAPEADDTPVGEPEDEPTFVPDPEPERDPLPGRRDFEFRPQQVQAEIDRLEEQREQLERFLAELEDEAQDAPSGGEAGDADGGTPEEPTSDPAVENLRRQLEDLDRRIQNLTDNTTPTGDPARDTASGPGPGGPEDTGISWEGGGRVPLRDFDIPAGAVPNDPNRPSRIETTVRFEVAADGTVTLLRRPSTGYTRLDEAIEALFVGRVFRPVAGAPPARGEITFIIESQ